MEAPMMLSTGGNIHGSSMMSASVVFVHFPVYFESSLGQGAKMKKVALYLRVSTDDQTTDNQRRELEAVASRHNWTVVRVFEEAALLAPRVVTHALASTP